MRWLLALYPRAWRERYQEEVLALLEAHQVTPVTVFDLLGGALDAHLHYEGFGEGVIQMVRRMRSSIVMIFTAFMFFGVGWAMVQRVNDPLPYFQAANSLHPEFGILHNVVFIVGCIAFFAFLVGGLPVFVIATKRAFQNKTRNVLTPFWIALSSLLLFIAATAGLVFWRPTYDVYALLMGYLILSTILLSVGTVAVSLVIARSDFQLSELKLMYIPEIAIVLGMVVSVVLSTVLMVTVKSHAPQLLITQDVSSPLFVIGILLMAFGTIVAAVGLKRGVARGTDQPTLA